MTRARDAVRVSRLPVRLRLIAGFAGAMLVVLAAAGAFVFWRVQVDLDDRLDQDLRSQTRAVRGAARTGESPQTALASLRDQARYAQLLGADGTLLASGSGVDGSPLLTSPQARVAATRELNLEPGNLLSRPGRHLRVLALPVGGSGPAAVAVSAVRLDQRDEALRELLAQLAIANLLALALASLVGYRLAHGALDPVEHYRAQAEQIAQGETNVRLDVPDGPLDEITRLGSTLNAMLDAQRRAAERQQQFIDDASHELRTPLATLSAEIDIALRKRRTVEEHEATLRRLSAGTTRLIDLAETLLALGALGSATPNARPVPARALLAAAARRAAGQLGTDVPRAVDARSEEGLVIHADPELLDRALGNLVDNAVRHGAGTITLRADLAPGGVPGHVITVHDEGTRLEADFLPHAAERFRQEDSARSRSGAGLGLSLVDEIVTAHAGQLRICASGRHHHQPTDNPALARTGCSHPSEGTTVTLILPAAASPVARRGDPF